MFLFFALASAELVFAGQLEREEETFELRGGIRINKRVRQKAQDAPASAGAATKSLLREARLRA